MSSTSDLQNENITARFLTFLLITFGLTWGIAATFILFNDQVTAIFGEMGLRNPLFILAVYSPGFAGIFMVWRKYGLAGLGPFFRRLTLWRMSPWWWLFLIFGIPAFMYGGAAIKGDFGEAFSFSPLYPALTAIALALLLGPIEEFGWRGFALPLVQRRFSPFWSALLIGSIWMIWHIPAFLIGGTLQNGWSFFPYFVGGVAISVIFTAMFNNSGGSLLIAALMHFQLNNPIWPDAQPWDNLLIVIIAIITLWFNRKTMFKRGAGNTDILLAKDSNRP